MKNILITIILSFCFSIIFSQNNTEIENNKIKFLNPTTPSIVGEYAIDNFSLINGFKLFFAEAGQFSIGDDLQQSFVNKNGLFLQQFAVSPSRSSNFGVSDLSFTKNGIDNTDKWTIQVTDSGGDRAAFSITENNTLASTLGFSLPLLIHPHNNSTFLNDIIFNGFVGINVADPEDGLHIKQKNDDYTIADLGALRLERADNTQNWTMVADTFNDLTFLHNGICIGYINHSNQQYTPCGLVLAKSNKKSVSAVLAKLANTDVVSYQSENGKIYYELDEQKMEKYFPEILVTSRGGNSIDKTQLSVLSIKAIQEQQALIEAQQAENNALKTAVSLLTARIDRLEKMIHNSNK